jgi:DNA adenine methylase
MPDLHEYKNKAIKVRPLLKWAGGKRQIMHHLISKLPEKFSVYYEPFFGAGALFLELYNRGLLKKAVISDLNKELIALYTLVRDRCSGIIEELENIRFINNKDDYYRARDLFNSMESDHNPEKAALMIYLNRHAYNGLYRVNSSGKFNVPFGRYAHPSLPTPDDIISFSKALSHVKIINKDFETAVSDATVSDFVYFDPPYAPLSRSSDFSAYSSLGFSLDEIAELLRLDDGTPCDEASHLAEHKLQDVREKMADLARMEAVLSGLVCACHARKGNVSCPLIASLQNGTNLASVDPRSSTRWPPRATP